MRTHHQGTVENLPKIVSWIRAKKQNEFELARRILLEFEQPALLNPLRGWIDQALRELDTLRRTDAVGQRIVSTAWNNEKGKLKTLKKYDSLSALLRAVPNLSATECGDLIRLYGTVAEVGGKKYQEKLAAYRAQPTQYVPFNAGVARPYGAQLEKQKALRKYGDVGWGKRPEQSARARVTPDAYRQTFGAPPAPGQARQQFLGLGGGINAWVLLDESTVHKIDRLFGLPLGADISGTTTDTIAFLGHFVAAGVNPLYYLLPIATIVAAGHHTILESALALTHNWQITGVEYRIGFYTTLLPRNAFLPAGSNIKSVLQQYQDDVRNRLLLIYYEGPDRVGGCYEYADPTDRVLFRRIALADAFLMMRVRCLSSPWISESDLENFESVGWGRR